MIKTSEKREIKYVDATSICSFNRCPARYFFSRVLGLSQPDKTRIYLDFGTDMHAAFPLCYFGHADEAVKEFAERWSERKYGDDDPKRNGPRAVQMLIDFASNHEPKICPYKVLNLKNISAPTAEKVSEKEIPFLIDIGGKLPFAGRIDLAVQWKTTGEYWALDFKTSSEISTRYFDNFHNSPQAVGYTLALSHILGENVTGMIIEAIRVSKKNTENMLSMIYVQDHQIESFINFANRTADGILKCNDLGLWPKNPAACGSYSMFGHPGWFCEFKDICDCPNWEDGAKYYKQSIPFSPFKLS